MIEDLINQYNALRERGEAVGYGEESVNIPYAVRLDDEGQWCILTLWVTPLRKGLPTTSLFRCTGAHRIET